MPENTISFYKIKHFIKVRNLFFLLFKITTIIIFFLLLLLFFFIVLLSTKPRKIALINNYIIEKLNKVESIDFNYNPETSLLSFNKNLELEYVINNFSAKNQKFNLGIDKILLEIDFSELIFGKVDIKNFNFINSKLQIFIDQNTNNQKKMQNVDFNYKSLFKSIQDKIINSTKYYFIIQQFTLNNFKIEFLNADNTNNFLLNINDSNFSIDFSDNNFRVYQEVRFTINDLNDESKILLICDNEEYKICDLKLYNININNFKNIFKHNKEIFYYINNINVIFNLNLNLTMDEDFNFKNGNINLFSSGGDFYLKEFFDEKIFFSNFNLDFTFKDNFEEFSINSLKTNFKDADFFMSLFFKVYKDYKNLDLTFKANNLSLKILRQLWPKSLGKEEGIRDWVLTHIIDGNIPTAFANMNLKYFDNNKKDSGLQKIYSKVQMKNILLNYDDYFPEIKNINGLAVFTENDMNIDITSGDVLNSKINKGNIFIDFNKKNEEVEIVADVTGPFADLFVHINKNDKKIIETNVNSAIEDYYTNSNLFIKVPLIDDLDFKRVAISVNSNISNKTNYIFENNGNILLSFIKKQNSNNFSGKVDFTNSEIVFLPLNLIKEANKNLIIEYMAELDDNNNIVRITKFSPINKYITFHTSGYINFDKNEQEIIINDIKYNDSYYNVLYHSYVANNKIFNNILINGKNINYSNIVERLQNIKINDKKNTNIQKQYNNEVYNETTIKVNLEYLDFMNNKKILKPNTIIIFKNNILDVLELYAKMNNKKYIKILCNREKNNYLINSNDFGTLLSTVGITDSLKGGNGYIEFSFDDNNNIDGSVQLEHGFSITPTDNLKEDVLVDVNEDQNFKELKKGLKKKKGLNFDKMIGDFSYSNKILKLKEIVASSKYIGFQILASGSVDVSKQSINIQGLFVPLGIINGLFGMNKLPLISDIIFGQKNAGLFASKFEIIKNKNEKLKININKFSTLLPGFLRNVVGN